VSDQYVEVEYDEFIRETEKVGLFRIDGHEQWLPWSQIEDGQDFEKGVGGTVSMTKWIADQKAIEYIE
jgi:hypothetical protein